MRKDYDIVGSYDAQRVSPVNAERTVNLFEYIDENAKRPKTLFPTSGLTNTNLNFLSELTGSANTFVFKNIIYQVFGQSVYAITGITGNLTANRIGTLINADTGYVGIDANTFQVIFVDGRSGYIYDTNTGVFSVITDTGFPTKPIDVCAIDNFFLVANGDTNQFQLSFLNQGMSWSGDKASFTADSGTDTITLTSVDTSNFALGVPIQFTIDSGGTLPSGLSPPPATYYSVPLTAVGTIPGKIKVAATYADAIHQPSPIIVPLVTDGTPPNSVQPAGELQLGQITSHPGNIVACRTLHRRVFLFSLNFTEVWENSGIGANLPLRRSNSLLMEVGTPAIGSIAVGFDRMFFLSQDADGLGAVTEVRGTEAIPVSSRALDFQLASYDGDPALGVADGRGIVIKENGLIFYRLNFTKANHTWVLNVSMSTIDKQRWHEEEVLNGNRHPAQTHVYYNGSNYYGHYSTPILYRVDSQVSTNDGETIRRMRIGRQMTPPGYNRLRIDRFQLDLLQGHVDVGILSTNFLTADTGFDLLTDADSEILLNQQLVVANGPQPVVFLSISKDGGQSYGYTQIAPMGQIGQRTFRTVWRKLGTTPRGQGFVPKIEFYNQIPFVILGAAWDYEVLPE